MKTSTQDGWLSSQASLGAGKIPAAVAKAGAHACLCRRAKSALNDDHDPKWEERPHVCQLQYVQHLVHSFLSPRMPAVASAGIHRFNEPVVYSWASVEIGSCLIYCVSVLA